MSGDDARGAAETLRQVLGNTARVHANAATPRQLTCRVPFPTDLRAVRQALLALDHPRATLRADNACGCVLEVNLSDDDEWEDGDDSAEDATAVLAPDDIEYDLTYCDNNSGIRQIIQALYSLCHGIKVYANRRECTEKTCCLIVDGVRTLYMEPFARTLLDNMAHFVVSADVIASKRLRIQARLLGHNKRKRKRA